MCSRTTYKILFLVIGGVVVQLQGLSKRSHNIQFSYEQDFGYRVQNEQQLEEDEVHKESGWENYEGTMQDTHKYDHLSYRETIPQRQELAQDYEEYEQVVPSISKQVQNQQDQEYEQVVLRRSKDVQKQQDHEYEQGVSSGPFQQQMHQQKVEDEPPYFDASMVHTYTAFLGRSASLTCIVHDVYTENSVSWIRDRDLRILTVGRYTYTTDLRFEALHQPGSSEWTMRIKTVQARDEGNYECQIATKPTRTFNVFLKVVEPTVEILGSPDIYVNIGSMINLTCIIHNAPSPPKHIRWFHYNESISYTSSRGGVTVVEERGETTSSCLLLQKARPFDSGPYKCHPHGMQPVMFTVYVLDGTAPAAELYAARSQADCETPSLKSLIALLVLAFMGS